MAIFISLNLVTLSTGSPLPNKFDINSTSFGANTTPKSSHNINPFLKKSLTRNHGPNRDPGVNSEDEDDDFDRELGEDDMFRYLFVMPPLINVNFTPWFLTKIDDSLA